MVYLCARDYPLIVHPGIPPFGYGQSYYTLRSIFLDGIPPPKVHMHIRKFDVGRDVPIGDLSSVNPSSMPNGNSKSHDARKEAVETDIPQGERDKFETWLRDLWRKKDDDMARFLEAGSFVPDPSQRFDIPVALKIGRAHV